MGSAVRALDNRALVDVIVAAYVIFHIVIIQTCEKGILHVGIGIRVAGKGRILVVFSHYRLMGKDEGMFGTALFSVKAAADPVLLIGYSVSVCITIGIVVEL